MIVVMILDIVLIIFTKFAPQPTIMYREKTGTTTVSKIDHPSGAHPSMLIDGTLLIAVGFTLSFTFYIFSQYAPNFGISVLRLSDHG
ncbi:hypothetical protein ACKI1O_49100, partial [Streptomyces scabiei]